MKKIYIIAASILILSLSFFLLKFRSKSNLKSAYTFVEVSRGNLENIVSATGTLNPVSTVEVGTQVTGIVHKVYADFNDIVCKNQLLAVIDTTILSAQVRDARANLLKAQAQHDKAKFDYERTKTLFEQNLLSELEYIISKTNYESAQASLQSARNNLDRAERDMKYAFIYSPIDGTVINRSVEEGQTMTARLQTPTLFLIAEDLSKMEIHAQVDESDIGVIHEGIPVRFEVQAYDDRTFSGKVRQVRLQPQTVQNVVNYTVVIDAENKEGLLLPGMTATIDFIVEQKQDVLLVPTSALKIQPTEDMMTSLRKRMEQRFADVPDSVRDRFQARRSRQQVSGMDMSLVMRDRTGTQRRGNRILIWYLDKEGQLRAQPVRTGTTDGKNTEIVALHDNIKEGMQIIGSVQGEPAKTSSNRSNRMPMSRFSRRPF